MLRRISVLTLVTAMLAVLVYAGLPIAPPRANAAPPPPCPGPPNPPSGVTYHVFATLPIGVVAAPSVCIQFPGFPPLNTGRVTQAPPSCPAISPPSVDASNFYVWADWGVPCVAAGQTVVLQFQGPAGLPLGRQPNVAIWGNGITTDATVWPDTCPASPPGVGGVPLLATAIAPAGGPYDGVCMSFVAPIPGVHSPVVLVSPPACPVANAVVGAAVLQVWDDFTTKCANAGDPITVQFWGPPGLVGPCAGCATWLDGAVIGDVTITAVCGPAATDPDGDGDIDWCDPGPAQPCVQDHAVDVNDDGYSDSDELTPTGAPSCTGAFPVTGGLGLTGLSSSSISAPCLGRLYAGFGGTPAQDKGARLAHADVDLSGKVALGDLIVMAGQYMKLVTGPTDMRAELDLSGNGKVDLADLIIAAGLYNQVVPPC